MGKKSGSTGTFACAVALIEAIKKGKPKEIGLIKKQLKKLGAKVRES